MNKPAQNQDLLFLIIFLNRPEFLEDILEAFLELGIAGATVIDSVGMGRIIAHEIPIFAGLQQAFPKTIRTNKIIFTVTEKKKTPEIFEVVQEICGDFNEPGKGLIITIPILDSLGFRPGF